MLTHAELGEIMAGKFQLDLNRITLKCPSGKKPGSFEGRGYVRQQPAGCIVFKLYADERDEPDLAGILRGDGLQCGQVVPDENFYDLEAEDIQGRRWAARLVDPDTDYRGLTVVSGSLHQLDHVDPTRRSSDGVSSRLILHVPYAGDIPCNTSSEETLLTGGELVRKSMRWDTAKFEACGYSFTLTKQADDVLAAQVDSAEAPFLPFAEERICESLQFVLGEPMRWQVMTLRSPTGERMGIRSSSPLNGQHNLLPPIGLASPRATQHIPVLLDRFLAHVHDHADMTRPPLSIAVEKVQQAGGSSIEAQALMLCVVVEELLTEGLAALARPPVELASQVAEFVTAMRGLPGHDGLKRRVEGAIGSWRKPHTNYCCRRLVDAGLVEEDMIGAWKGLRNAAVHADSSRPDDFQRLLDQLHLVTVLFYRLIFLIIGYEGCYKDYGTLGWPEASFRGTLPREPVPLPGQGTEPTPPSAVDL